MIKETPQTLARIRSLCSSGAAKAIRESGPLSLREMGTGVGVAQVTIWRWENGRTRPSGFEAMAYLAILDDLAGVSK